MNNLSIIFQTTNRLALIGWLLLFFAPFIAPFLSTKAFTLNHCVSLIILILSASYIFSLMAKFLDEKGHHPKGHFFSLKGVSNLFKHPRAVLVGWIHYLAFDLFVGLFIYNHAQEYSISHWWLVPVLFFTLMFGPTGLLIYACAGFALFDGFTLF